MAKKKTFKARAPRTSNLRGFGTSLGSPSSTIMTPACGEDSIPVSIQSDCDSPVFVELCPQSVGIETSLAELGCVLGPDGEVIGKVMLAKIIDEATGVETVTVTAYYTDGSIEENYTGEWGVCENPQVDIEKFEYCNLETGTKWIRECQYVTIGTETKKTVLDEFDTGFPCVQSIVIENEYCVIQRLEKNRK